MKGLCIDLLRIPDLADHAKEHDADSVGNELHHRQVMGYEQISQSVLLLQILQQVQHLGLDGYVQSRYGLVTDDQPRIQGQGPGNADPLPLSPGKLMGITVGKLSGDAHLVHQLIDSFRQLFLTVFMMGP